MRLKKKGGRSWTKETKETEQQSQKSEQLKKKREQKVKCFRLASSTSAATSISTYHPSYYS